jgi:hypothetical protein
MIMARNWKLGSHPFWTSSVTIEASLAAAAIAALVTIVPEWTRAAYTKADTKKANEKNVLENIANAPPLPDVVRLSAPALIPNSDSVRFEFTHNSGGATHTTVAAAPSLESSFARGEGLLFVAKPVGSNALRRNEAFTSIHDSPSVDSADDVTADTSLPKPGSAVGNIDIPLPPSRPIIFQYVQAPNQSFRPNDTSTMAGTRQTASFASFAWLKKLFRFLDRGTPVLPPEADSQTAVYDIEEHVVYLPNGEELEAHSGLGKWLDDPQYVNVKGRGPIPPNNYRLSLREKPFHGVQAIRLNPVGGGNMYGRNGMLAHPYMLGANGQSNGCVSLQDYPRFLQAFLKGDISRLIVVAHLDRAPSTAAYGQVDLAEADTVLP